MTDVRRGELWWGDLGDPIGSAPGHRRPLLVVQSDVFNKSAIGSVVCVALTSNLRRARAAGNVALPAGRAGLAKDSVVNVAHVVTIDRAALTERIGALSPATMKRVDEGIRLALDV